MYCIYLSMYPSIYLSISIHPSIYNLPIYLIICNSDTSTPTLHFNFLLFFLCIYPSITVSLVPLLGLSLPQVTMLFVRSQSVQLYNIVSYKMM